MRELLRDRSLVDEQPAWTKHARYFAKRGASTIGSPADVVASSEIDHEIEAS
jgi:hypothetical protein